MATVSISCALVSIVFGIALGVAKSWAGGAVLIFIGAGIVGFLAINWSKLQRQGKV